ncbi:hypothetical protein T265_05387 [Opisthorchis viverrini]|uniref:Mediator of RNA polymerase II transcription subunit 22 n=1 Tax=Opisthorchis viverrini TaxID=6198 RepID=A0A074ZJP7_OPIVI|nr:hypothetical protein T265_05387 [Opisthorchis viverrini]KER27568.1 hypothetical protein T265_05387 [Opisthorchis viverrini]
MQSTQRSATNPSSTLQLAAARKRDSQVQGLKSRLRMNMTAITENYEMILSRAKVDPNDNPSELGSFAQTEQDTFEMSVRAANIVIRVHESCTGLPDLDGTIIGENPESGISAQEADLLDTSYVATQGSTNPNGNDHVALVGLELPSVHACENLTRLVSEIKQMLILGDFRWLAQITTANAEDLRKRRAHLDRISLRLRDKLVADLYAIEEECAGGGSLFAATAVPPPTTLSSD